MRIQYVRPVDRPRAMRGDLHEIREVPDSIGRTLIDGEYAVLLTPQPVAAPAPKPPPAKAPADNPKPKTSKKSRRDAYGKTTRRKP